RFLPGLRSSSSSVRHRAAQSLRLYIESESRDLSHGLYMKWVTDISARLLLLCNSNENADRMGGIAAMDELVELFIAERNDQTIIEFAHSLTKVFEKIPSAEPPMLRVAAKALGHIVSTGGTSLIEFVEDYHVKPALEWLKNETFHVRRHAAVVILKELSINAPSTSFRYMDKYFDFIWSAFWDSKLVVRVSASESLQSCFMLIQQRESNRKTSWYNRALDEAEGAFKRNSSDATHGALLILNELLRNTGDFMHSHYARACRLVFSHQDHKSATVRSAVISLFPRLAKFNTSVFVEKCYRPCMNHLLEVLFSATTTTRPDALLSIGKLSLAIGPLLARDEQALMAIMNGIKGGLQVRRKDFDTHREALACLRMLAETVGPALIRVDLESMVGPLFQNDLDSSLVETLTTIVKKIPPMKPIIQQKLFERLSSILRSRQNDITGSATTPTSRKLKTASISVTVASAIAMQALALETLANFDFQGNRLIPIMSFVHETVVKFLDHEVATIRKSAALTCCKLLLPPGEDRSGGTAMTSEDFARPVTSVLERLLTVGIADTEASIRLRVLASLDSRFDPLLALNDNLRCLFIALNDEVFSIRQTAMSTLGRLTHHNPSTVLPSLRQTLVQLLAELEFSGDSRGKEEGALLIGCLLRSASQLAQPYVLPILRVLMKNLREDSERRSHSRSTVSVSKAILATLGDLAEVGAQELTPYLGQLLPDVIDEMRDSSNPQILQVAIKTLGQLVSSTGYVVLPYHEYPELLDLLCQALQKSGDPFESLRIEAGRTLGILGALDPYNLRLFHLQKQGKLTDAKKKEFRSSAFAVDDLLPSMIPDSSQYFPTVATNALIRILLEPRNSVHYQGTFMAIMYICKSQRKRMGQHLDKIIPAFLYALEKVNRSLRKFLFEQLCDLVQIVEEQIQPHLDHVALLSIVNSYWDEHLEEVLNLVKKLANSLGEKFRVYLPDLVPQMLRVIRTERDNPARPRTLLVLKTAVSLGRLLDGYLHLIIPALVALIQSDADVNSRKQGLGSLGSLVKKLNVSVYASKIIHMLARVISSQPEMVYLAMDCLCCMVYTMGDDYAIFVPVISQVLGRHTSRSNDIFDRYDLLVSKILKYQPLPVASWATDPLKSRVDTSSDHKDSGSSAQDETKSLPCDQKNLVKAWEASQRSTKEDWNEWILAFSVELLRESPSPVLRACKELASVYQPLARELFNASFVSVWPHLSPPTQDNLIRSLESAFQSPHLPSEILQTLLNLAEFMEHDDQPLPIDIRLLGSLADKCHSFAKALHYKELEFNTNPSTDGIQALISINSKLNQPEAAGGILKYALEKLPGIEVKASWHEKLLRWDDALATHDRVLQEDPNNVESIFGKMRCLWAIGEWRKLNDHVQETWSKIYGEGQDLNELCSSGARVAFSLQNWDSIPKYINSDMDATESHLFKAVVSIRRMELDEAMSSIADCRKEMDPTLRSLVSESYARAYLPAVVNLQMLTELEEIKQVALKKLQTIWTRRMLGVERNIQVWQSLMLVRSLVFDPREDVDIWLKYARLCLKSGHINLASSALWRVGAQPFIRSVERDPAAQDPRVAFSYLRHLWAENREDVALKQMDYFIEALEQHGDPTNEDMRRLRVQVYIQLGEWQMSLAEPRKQADGALDHVLECLETATKLDPTNDRAWHEWALMNFRALEATVKESGQGVDPKRYAVRAIQGFFRSISFGHTSYDVTKDVLRLLTLWFAHGNRSDVHMAMIEGFQEASIDTWLDVIPQLIARIDTPNPKTSELLHELLSRIGQAHPQALIYPITVASKALNPIRKLAAEGILAAVRRHSSQLVYEADMVSRELIRVAILWNELWHGALEEASKHFFNNRDVTAMIAELAPLHELMEKINTEEAPTLREVAFYQAFARDLKYAKEWTNVYERTKSLDDLNQAWDIYYSVFSKIRKQLANLSTLELANVGPKLLSVRNLTLAVPGTYKAGAPIVRIQSFDTKVTVLTSKQRPRKVSINGSDGKAYPFLLKGHEDLRQDERVMQLFGVINTVLANDSDTSKRNLAIERYSVLPLSHTSGLIGWVPNCDTLHQLIRDYREARKIQLNVEHRLMVQMAPDYDKLPLMQKVEAFKYALGETTGQDLYRVLWLKSQDSEVWLDRRRNFTRSLAVMSMAGYILGLGDRHPSNLMLDRVSGKLVHIDFGDCFEVAMERDKYPEKIPFRLTRMLTQAMEVSGIEGNFRYTCEASMRVLRDNRDSLMAVLEAFVYDPLINWRLLKKDTSSTSSAPVTPRRRRHSSSEAAMLGYNMDIMDPAMARNSMSETQRDNFGMSFVATEHPQLNEKAVSVVDRVKKKLAGRDFDDGSKVLTVDAQVDRLIHQATSHENLCQLYYGWCPFW
uniref:Serine/threonine-protein kinase TOR n=1 Tax=Phytophthora ramorum TaxID=164328 RepID=H3G802_PHYRM